jgi:hypothetical protein
MVTDHTGVNKQAVERVSKLEVTPEDNLTSKSLKKDGDDNLKALKGLRGAAFDKAYIEHEVAYHQQCSTRSTKPDPECAERRTEGPPGGRSAGLRRTPRAGQVDPDGSCQALTAAMNVLDGLELVRTAGRT